MMTGKGAVLLQTKVPQQRPMNMHQSGQRAFALHAWRLNEGAPLPGMQDSNRGFDMAQRTARARSGGPSLAHPVLFHNLSLDRIRTGSRQAMDRNRAPDGGRFGVR